MATLQFKAGKVLFKGGKVSFCPAHCTCGTLVPDPVPPPAPPGCNDCKSTTPCSGLPCTPKTLQITFSTVSAPSLSCGGETLSLTASPTGPYRLDQDAANPCRWLMDTPASALTLTGTSGATTSRLRIAVEKVPDGFSVVASMIFPGYNEFVLFGGTYLHPTIPDSFTVSDNGQARYCLGAGSGGGRIGTGGNAEVSQCPPLPKPCPTDVPSHCHSLLPADLTSVVGFTPCVNDIDGTCFPPFFSVYANGTGGSGSFGGVSDFICTLGLLDSTAPLGCGWYLDVLQGGDVVGSYYLPGLSSAGRYVLFTSTVSNLPAALTVVKGCTDCSQNSAYYTEWPTSVTLRISGDTTGLIPDGDYPLPPSGSGYLQTFGGITLRVQCDDSTGTSQWWIQVDNGSDVATFAIPAQPGPPPAVIYPVLQTSGDLGDRWGGMTIQLL